MHDDLTIPAFLDRRRPTSHNAKYTVVENAGYEGENDRMAGFNTAETAWRYAERIYRKGELESLHVQVRKDFDNGEQTYEY